MRILLGLSGGVDSTYAALKLKRQGHDVEGAVVLMHVYTDTEGARRAANEVGVPLHEIDATGEFDAVVCSNFVSEYVSGRTPNPCVICNREVKFRALCDFARKNGFDAVATGHYAKVRNVNTESGVRYFIAPADDLRKDQSYMLSRLTQDELSMLVLPMGDEIKSEITERAHEIGLSAAQRGESQEICFIPDGKYTNYIETRAGKMPEGRFIGISGETLGIHKGIIHYTVGQRKGLNIALGQRVFVTEINASDNTVRLEFAPKGSDIVYLSSIVYSKIAPPKHETSMKLFVKLRYLARLVECELYLNKDGSAVAYLAHSETSVTPGQSAVFYDSDGCVLSGIIMKSEASDR